MDSQGHILKEGDIIEFNASASYNRENLVFATLLKMDEKNGTLRIGLHPKIKTIEYMDPTQCNTVVRPDVSKILSHDHFPPKRGKHASPGCYRWEKEDVLIYKYDPSKNYTEDNYF